MRRPNARQAGAVLVLAVLLMTAVVVTGSMYLELSVRSVAYQDRTTDRLRARALADGALELAENHLVGQPTFRGNLPAVNEPFGRYQTQISGTGSEVDIEVHAVVGDASSKWTARATVSGWTERIRLTFDNSLQGTNLLDFPVLVVLDASRIDYTKTAESGADLRFFDSDGARLPHEIERWNSSGTSYVWVSVPQIDALSTTDHIWLHYGNAGADDDQSPTDVWNTDYLLVWHGAVGGGDAVLDSTANGHDGDKHSSTEPSSVDLGRIGAAQAYDGVDDGIEVKKLEPAVAITMEAWIFPTGFHLSEWGTIMQFKSDKPFLGFCESPSTPGDAVLNFWRDKDELKGITSVPTNTWNHVAVTHDSNDVVMYMNGAVEATGTVDSDKRGDDFYVGIWDTGTTDSPFQGIIDEIRVSNVVRSGDWIAAQHLSMTDRFITYGLSESIPGVSPEVEIVWRRPGASF